MSSDLGIETQLLTSSSLWFSGIIPGGCNWRKLPVYIDDSPVSITGDMVQKQRYRERGVSLMRNSDGSDENEDELFDATSGYKSMESWKHTLRRTPTHPNIRCGGVPYMDLEFLETGFLLLHMSTHLELC
ncbi:hypothetical protein L1887_23559 [Cichorium endivia]|nr:hypothetical protein L1887_23559 [Cichorium endivia]